MKSSFLSAEQSRLLELLGGLIAEHGYERFVRGPILEPGDVFGSRGWSSTRGGVRRLARRLLQVVGIDHLRVVVDDLRLARSAEPVLQLPELSFARIHGDNVVFELHELGDAEDVLGMLTHEVGRAFRAIKIGSHPFRGQAPSTIDPSDEIVMGSVAAVYLGLGLFATNASHSARSSSTFSVESQHMVTETEVMEAGGLSPDEMVFLLALQLVVSDRDEVEQPLSLLQRQLSDRCQAAIASLAPHKTTLRDSLGIPPPRRWPPADDFALPPPCDDDDEDADESLGEERARLRKFNVGCPVFRVAKHKAFLHVLGGSVLGGALSAAALVSGLGAAVSVACLLTAPAVAGWMGKRQRYFICSDPQCVEPLLPDLQECPNCGGTIAGEIANPNQRLDAEELLESGEL